MNMSALVFMRIFYTFKREKAPEYLKPGLGGLMKGGTYQMAL